MELIYGNVTTGDQRRSRAGENEIGKYTERRPQGVSLDVLKSLIDNLEIKLGVFVGSISLESILSSRISLMNSFANAIE